MGEVLDNNGLENEKSMRRFLIIKYLIELLVLLSMLVALGIFSYFGFIESCTIGTLLGVIIGYFARGIRKIHK